MVIGNIFSVLRSKFEQDNFIEWLFKFNVSKISSLSCTRSLRIIQLAGAGDFFKFKFTVSLYIQPEKSFSFSILEHDYVSHLDRFFLFLVLTKFKLFVGLISANFKIGNFFRARGFKIKFFLFSFSRKC